MQRILFLVFFSFLLFNCQQKKSNINFVLNKEIEIIIKNLNKDVKIETKSIKDKIISIEIEILKPYDLTNVSMQKSLSEYLLFRINLFENIDKVEFFYFLDKERGVNRTKFLFKKEKIINIRDKFKKEHVYLNMLEICLKRMKQLDPFLLEVLQEFVNKKYLDDTLDNDFFEILYSFSKKEGNKLNKKKSIITMGKSSFTIYNMYSLSQKTEDKKYTKMGKLLNKIWNINYGNTIENSVVFDKKTNSIFLKK